MNERIRELAEQASHQSPDGYPVTIPYSKDFAEKFAELIVGECLDQLFISDPAEDFDKGIAWSAKQIREHFGVEE